MPREFSREAQGSHLGIHWAFLMVLKQPKTFDECSIETQRLGSADQPSGVFPGDCMETVASAIRLV